MEALSGISALLPVVIRAFDGIQVARAFEGDLKLHQISLDIVQLRLSRWAAAVGLGHDPAKGDAEKEVLEAAKAKFASPGEIETAEELVNNIKKVLRDAQEASKKMQHQEALDEETNTEDDLAPRFKRLHQKLRALTHKRLHHASIRYEGTKWSLYKKDQAEALVTKLLDLIEQLEQLVEPAGPQLDELTQDDCRYVGESARALLEVLGDSDPRLRAAATESLKGEEATYSVSVKTGTNYGMVVGVNNKEIKGISFGSGGTVNNHW
ncbi:uncharacterized protein DNG_07527 [Cephalotrichum gorgonifer]|uniref:Prion-inhibition and propagation HeLo domain-containing protein n=1 Tax=Cephalotrichum gorgonifer TaxID=2041049 RepID=A0AAE8N4T7_9PEZI|nr:uncharacterized protein DNG_07527 [Cephalotrichum gorgonifer]